MTTHSRHAANMLAGFTLVEILVVIVIIGLLAGMTTTVVVSARRSVNNSIVSSQMAQLSIALDEYKNRFGEYPPDLSDPDAVMRHLKKRWPRYTVKSYTDFISHVVAGCHLSSGHDVEGDDGNISIELGTREWVLDQGRYISSLVFWLGGLPDRNGVPSGFYASPKCPFGVYADGTVAIRRLSRAKKEKPFFTFDKKYLRAYGYDADIGVYSPIGDGRLDSQDVCIPAYCQGEYPVVYFKPSVSIPYGGKSFRLSSADGVSTAVPYAESDSSWYEEKRFQLVHPGADGLFGSLEEPDSPAPLLMRVVPIKGNLSLEDADNITNFIEGGTLESLYD